VTAFRLWLDGTLEAKATSRMSGDLFGLVSCRVGDAQSARVAKNFEGLHLIRESGPSIADGGDFDRECGGSRTSTLGELNVGRCTALVSCIREVRAEAETFLGDG
jgi:hypothetical protein